MNKNRISLSNICANSKFSYIKNFIYFLIAPLVLILIGIIIFSIVGFNYGTDFVGGKTFKVYVNNDAIIQTQNVANYDISDSEEYNQVCLKIESVLSEYDVSVLTYRKTSITINEYNIFAGQAIEVVVSNFDDESDNKVHEALVNEFNYTGFEDSITQIEKTQPTFSFDWFIALLSSLVFALIIAIIYLSLRFNISAIVVTILQVCFDLFLTLALIAICRVTVDLSIGVVMLTTLIVSLLNIFFYYYKTKENFKVGKYEKLNHKNMADITINDLTYKKVLIYLMLILIICVFIISSVNSVRMLSLGILMVLFSTFYNSQFILPTLWATCYKQKHNKKYYKK